MPVNALTLKERVARASQPNARVNMLSDAEFDALLAHVDKGHEEWIAMLPAFSKHTDAYFSEALGISLAEALLHNPEAVLRVADNVDSNAPLALEHICGVPFIEITRQEVLDYQRKANVSLNSVTQPSLQAKKSACLNVLNSPLPPESESDDDD